MLDTINALIETLLFHPGAAIVLGCLLCLPLILWLADNAQPSEEWDDSFDETSELSPDRAPLEREE